MTRTHLLCLALLGGLFVPPAAPVSAQNAVERLFGAKPAPKPKKKKRSTAAPAKKRAKAKSTAEKPDKSDKSAAAKRKSPTAVPEKPQSTRTPTPTPTPSPTPTPTPARGSGTTSSIAPSELREFSAQPEKVQRLIQRALALTSQGLTYTYGSAEPSRGGMDCSGTIYHLLKDSFSDVPRQANEQYIWVRKKRFFAVLSRRDDTFELADLQPGDLMFWTGTYGVDRDPPVTHTMLYLGTHKTTGKRLMFGASNGRTYNGAKQNGVSVFDFKVPSARQRTEAAPENAPDFSGYGPIPGVR